PLARIERATVSRRRLGEQGTGRAAPRQAEPARLIGWDTGLTRDMLDGRLRLRGQDNAHSPGVLRGTITTRRDPFEAAAVFRVQQNANCLAHGARDETQPIPVNRQNASLRQTARPGSNAGKPARHVGAVGVILGAVTLLERRLLIGQYENEES